MRSPVVRTFLFLLAGAACTSPVAPGATSQGLVVHEWGTFTSLQSSTGESMDGLQHTDEFLPAFVHHRSPTPQKGIEALPEPVNEKLETPVLYFYSAAPRLVRVSVSFPQGIISEWYPEATSFYPAVGGMTGLAEGSMSWEAALDPGVLSPPYVTPDSIWAPSRKVASTGLRAGPAPGEDEGFIFYRGLGRFNLPLRVETIAGEMLRVSNDSEQPIPAAFLLFVHEGGGAIVELGALAPHASLVASPTPKERDLDVYLASASSIVARALEDTGLYADEARAMVDTWSRSYFLTHGLRVLYVVPRDWTDGLLPLRIDPTPDSLVRTLVGRIEVLTAAEEQANLVRLRDAQAQGIALGPDVFGRFTEPKLHRALQMIDDPALSAYTSALLEQAGAQP